jgi:hypothetical protein
MIELVTTNFGMIAKNGAS